MFPRISVAASLLLALAACGPPNRNAGAYPGIYGYGAPQPQPMDPARSLGLWKSSFGPVKIEASSEPAGTVQGVWVYERGGQEVVGYFAGPLRGNVLELSWEEPAQPQPLTGAGFLVFDPSGQSFSGKWWTDNRDRQGEWNGWRQDVNASPQQPGQPQYPQPQPYPQQPLPYPEPQQPQPYPAPQPYPQQPQPYPEPQQPQPYPAPQPYPQPQPQPYPQQPQYPQYPQPQPQPYPGPY